MANPTLQTFLTQTQRLLHDANFKYWTQQTMVDAINTACQRAVGDSQCNRLLQTIYLSPNLEVYSYGSVTGAIVTLGGSGYVTPVVAFSAPATAGGVTATGTAQTLNGAVSGITVTNGGSGYTSQPTALITDTGGGVGANVTPSFLRAETMDTLSMTLLYSGTRLVMSRVPFTRMQTDARQWINYQQYPVVYSSYGMNGWYLGPIPNQFYATEWDTIIQPPTLVNLTDVSVLQYPDSEPVPYYAAHVCKFMEQSYKEAEMFLSMYTQKQKYVIRSVMSRMLPTSYGG